MQRRVWAALGALLVAFSLALVFVTPAQAEGLPENPPQFGSEEHRDGNAVGSVEDSGERVSLIAGTEASGTGWRFDGDHTLTLSSYDAGSVILDGTMTIALEGDNRITPTEETPFSLTTASRELFGVRCYGFTPNPMYTEKSDLTITGSGTLTIAAGAQADTGYFGVLGLGLSIVDGATLSIDLPASEYAVAIELRMNGNNALYSDMNDYTADYSGMAKLTVDNATLNITSGETINAYDIVLNHCNASVTSLLDRYAIGEFYDKGTLTMNDVRGAYAYAYQQQYPTTDASGNPITVPINVTVLYSSGDNKMSPIVLVPGEGTDHGPGWYHDTETDDWYYYNEDGTFYAGMWLDLKTGSYYFGEDGKLIRNGWVDSYRGLSYAGDDGVALTVVGWKQIEGAWYYFEKYEGGIISGNVSVAYRNRWLVDGDNYYLFGPDGKLVTDPMEGFYGTSGTCTWFLDVNGLLTIYPTDGVSGVLENDYELEINAAMGIYYNTFNWYPYRQLIRSVVVEEGVSATSLEGMFYECASLTSADLSKLDTSQVTNMKLMFCFCSSLTSVNLSSFDTSNVTDMSDMFDGCTALVKLDVSGLNTSKVTNMAGMFMGCSNLVALDLSSFDTSSCTSMGLMFSGLTKLTQLTVGDAFVQPTDSGGSIFSVWSAPPGVWMAATNGLPYADLALATRVGADTYTRIKAAYNEGWNTVGSDYYYLKSGAPYVNRWLSSGGSYYYFGADAKLVINGWINSNGTDYYISGAKVATSQWATFEGGRVYLGKDGTITRNGWAADGTTYYYMGADGHPVTNTWAKAGSTYYYMGADGKVATNCLVPADDPTYYVGKDGKVANGWQVVDGAYYYFGSDYTMVRDNWVKYNGYWFYMDANGHPLVNTNFEIDGVRYFFNASGICTGYENVE